MARIYLSEFIGTPIPLSNDDYYGAFMDAAWKQLLASKLYYDNENGHVVENGSWVARPARAEDFDRNLSKEDIWYDYLSRHVKARAARLFNLSAQ